MTYGCTGGGRLGNVGAVGLRSVSLGNAGGARSGKFAQGSATLLKSVNRPNHLIGGGRRTAAAYRGTFGEQAPRRTGTGSKSPSSIQGVSLQRVGSMGRHRSRDVTRLHRARVANTKRAMAACGAKGGVIGTKRTRDRAAIDAHGAGTKRPRQMAARGANGMQVARLGNACAGRVGDVKLMVGLAQETDAIHAERHPLAQIG